MKTPLYCVYISEESDKGFKLRCLKAAVDWDRIKELDEREFESLLEYQMRFLPSEFKIVKGIDNMERKENK